MSGFEDVIHQPVRLKIMAALASTPDAPLTYSRLKSVSGAADGSLSLHVSTLERAGYVRIVKDFVGKKPRTRAELTWSGEKALRDYVNRLRDTIAAL